MFYSLFALLLGTFLGVRSQTIHQWPATQVQLVGSSVSLECTVKGTSTPTLYWYRQDTGKALQLLFYSISADQIYSEGPQNFSASRPEDGQFILSSKKLLLGDTGFYLCAWSPTLNWVGQASVQKPHPLINLNNLLQENLPRDPMEIFVAGFLSASQCTDKQWKNLAQVPKMNFAKFSGTNRKDVSVYRTCDLPIHSQVPKYRWLVLCYSYSNCTDPNIYPLQIPICLHWGECPKEGERNRIHQWQGIGWCWTGEQI